MPIGVNGISTHIPCNTSRTGGPESGPGPGEEVHWSRYWTSHQSSGRTLTLGEWGRDVRCSGRYRPENRQSFV